MVLNKLIDIHYNIMAKNILSDLRQIFNSSVAAVLPENLVKKSINYNSPEQVLTIAGRNYDLRNRNLYVIGSGKAVQSMAIEVEKTLGSKIQQGIISIPAGSLNSVPINKNMHYFEGAKNNLPDSEAMETARKVKMLTTELTKDDFLLVLLSGGGSSLLPLPKEPITLNEKTTLIKRLANSGADIRELNTVRKRISDIKGGLLAIHAEPAHVASLVLSDIVGDSLDLIASGPTTKNEDNPMEANKIINKYNLHKELPESIKLILDDKDNTLFPVDNVHNVIIGSNKLSIQAATAEAEKLDYYPIGLSNTVTGNTYDIAKKYVQMVRTIIKYKNGILDNQELSKQLHALSIPGLKINMVLENDNAVKYKNLCLVLGGETTVQVAGAGVGGRSQQLCLEFSATIHDFSKELSSHDIYILCAGTDGIDGPTDAAGAIGYTSLITDCNKANIDVHHYINNNDSYNFYKHFKNGELHVITGHTNTNVMDIHLIVIKNKCI